MIGGDSIRLNGRNSVCVDLSTGDTVSVSVKITYCFYVPLTSNGGVYPV